MKKKGKSHFASSAGRPAGRFDWRHLRTLEWDVAVGIVFLKLVLFVFVLAAVPAVSNRMRPFLSLVNQWDALRYLEVARAGYTSTGDERFNLVGLPLYPWLVRAVSWLGFGIPSAALLVSGVATLALGWLFLRLVRMDESEERARLAVWFLFIFPTAYFLHIAYTEATMLALTVGCFLAARRRSWAWAGLLGGLAALTRLQGLLLLAAVPLEAWTQYRETRRLDPRWLWLLVIPCGFGVYLWVNYHVTGDAFAFTKMMQENFWRELRPPWVGAAALWDNLRAEKPEDYVMIGLAEASFSLLVLGFTIWSWFVLRPSYAIWMTTNFLLCVCSSFVVAVPRYALVMFPIFILLARVSSGRPLVGGAISVCSILLLALFFLVFALGHWAF